MSRPRLDQVGFLIADLMIRAAGALRRAAQLVDDAHDVDFTIDPEEIPS